MELNIIDYKVSQRLSFYDLPFSALIAAAMRKADSNNIEKLKSAWPETFADLQKRYNGPGGATQEELQKSPNIVNDAERIADTYLQLPS